MNIGPNGPWRKLRRNGMAQRADAKTEVIETIMKQAGLMANFATRRDVPGVAVVLRCDVPRADT